MEMWSSKFMLPEHSNAIGASQRLLHIKKKPILAADALDDIQRAITASYIHKTEVSLILYDEYEELRAIGIVERIDQQARQVRIDGEWFMMTDVVGIESASDI